MTEPGVRGRGARALAALGFDPNSVLAKEPGVLLDPHFLGAMHAELEADLGSEDAAKTLMQVGLIQGLHDAWRAVADGFDGNQVLQPPLAIRFRVLPDEELPGAIEVIGCWPERTEAGGRLSLIGPCDHTACHLSAGYTSGWLSGTLDVNILAIETGCSAAGEEACRFVAREADAWRAVGDSRALALLDELPFDAIREFVRVQTDESPALTPEDIDPATPVIHIWDSVMVIPFMDGDESMRAVELIEQDAAARNVTVIVVDLDGAIIDRSRSRWWPISIRHR
ncbi:MAG: 4-vinyl reductase [Deltaproteobacteria bacterium]|nr:4-vinyl reductase [Deltaproteobacteria bacterium]